MSNLPASFTFKYDYALSTAGSGTTLTVYLNYKGTNGTNYVTGVVAGGSSSSVVAVNTGNLTFNITRDGTGATSNYALQFELFNAYINGERVPIQPS